MMRVAVNGLGRIGRALVRRLLQAPDFDIAAVNDLAPPGNLAYLLQYDTAYGPWQGDVEVVEGDLHVDGVRLLTLSEKDPADLPWKRLEVDAVFECTGAFRRPEDLEKHRDAGARRVLLSAPAATEDIPTVVHGVNTAEAREARVFSCASCTTQGVTPLLEVAGRRLGIERAVMNTLHSYTRTQELVDGPHPKPRRGRAAAANLVPSDTGAARATTRVLSSYDGFFDGTAVRCPLLLGSLIDLTLVIQRPVTREELNGILREEAESERYRGVLGVTDEPLVSSDIVGSAFASLVDLSLTRVVDGTLVKIMSWYDNEGGYAWQMLRTARALA